MFSLTELYIGVAVCEHKGHKVGDLFMYTDHRLCICMNLLYSYNQVLVGINFAVI